MGGRVNTLSGISIVAARLLRVPQPLWRVALVAVVATCLTHPLAWWLNHVLLLENPWRHLVIETAVALLEALAYAQLTPMRARPALAVSIAANATSWLVGLWLIRNAPNWLV